jgi:hypothetical protein
MLQYVCSDVFYYSWHFLCILEGGYLARNARIGGNIVRLNAVLIGFCAIIHLKLNTF